MGALLWANTEEVWKISGHTIVRQKKRTSGRKKQIEIHSEKTHQNVYKMYLLGRCNLHVHLFSNEHILYFCNKKTYALVWCVLFSITSRIREPFKLYVCKVSRSQNSMYQISLFSWFALWKGNVLEDLRLRGKLGKEDFSLGSGKPGDPVKQHRAGDGESGTVQTVKRSVIEITTAKDTV